MRELDAMDGERQPIWNFVEVGWPFTETAAQGGRAIAPAEIKAAVWHSIIAGAHGIIYFNHSFGGPEQTQHALRDPDYAAERAAVDSTDALIEQLAPVLNSPFDDGFVTVNSSVRAMAKYYNGEHYVFAGGTVNGAATGTDTFTLAGVSSGTAEGHRREPYHRYRERAVRRHLCRRQRDPHLPHHHGRPVSPRHLGSRARSRSTTSRSARATAARRWRPSRSHAAAARQHST